MDVKIACALFFGIMLILGVSLLSTGQMEMPVASDGNNVLFLEHYLTANGTVMNGSANFRTVDFPSYWFNENTRELNGEISFGINESLILIFGDSLTLAGNFGAGTGNKLYGIYSLPVQANEAFIRSIDTRGNVILTANNKTITLRPGATYAYSQNELVKDGDATVKIVYEHQYVNRGFINKGCIRTRMIANQGSKTSEGTKIT